MAAAANEPDRSTVPDCAGPPSLAKASGGPAESGRPGSPKWLAEHGIRADVWAAQGCCRYAPHDLNQIEVAFEGCAPNQIKWALKQAGKSPGIVMPKHPLPGLDALPIAPQLRPDNPRLHEIGPHYHPLARPNDYTPLNPKTNKPLSEDECWSAWEVRRHILGGKEHHPAAIEAAARRGFDTKRKVADLLDDPSQQAIVREILQEAASSYAEPHFTVEQGKYLLTITPQKPLDHDHADYKRPNTRPRHEQRRHAGEVVEGRHVHPEILVDDDDPKKNPGKRINVNPLSAKRLQDARFVFFGIEGTIKGCAMTSAILDGNLPALAIDVPSVGQWDAEELPRLVPMLADKKVVIVPDADGRDNPQVMNQARLLLARLARLGMPEAMCRIAAPPDDRDDRGELLYKGVDDFLGAGGNLLDLVWVGEILPFIGLSMWEAEHAKAYKRKDAIKRDRRVFEGLIRLGGESGKVQVSLKSVCRYLNDVGKPTSDDDVERAVKHLMPAWIETDMPLSARRWKRLTNRYSNPDFDWAEGQPTILIKHEALRAQVLMPEPIGNWLGRTPEQWEFAYRMQSAVRENIAHQAA